MWKPQVSTAANYKKTWITYFARLSGISRTLLRGSQSNASSSSMGRGTFYRIYNTRIIKRIEDCEILTLQICTYIDHAYPIK